jgi:photosystem II stability/assembly factor-like uncharacterized protein
MNKNRIQYMKRQLSTLFVLGLFAFLQSLIPTALAGVNQWTSAGPDGGYIRALVIDPLTPSILYAANGGGVYKSINSGGIWSAAFTGIISSQVGTLVINETTPSTLYAGTYDNGIFKTTNGGGSWSAVNSGIPSKFINAIAIDQSNPNTLYAGVFNNGIFKSTNAGSSWSQINTGLTNSFGPIDVRAIVVDRNSPNTLYIGGDGVYKSINGGNSWNPVNAGLTDANGYTYYVYELVIDRDNSNILYAGTSQGVFKSINGGGNWSPVNNGLTSTSIWVIALDKSNPTTLFAGASYGGLFKSVNAGSSWSPVNTGYPSANIQSIAINPFNSSILYAGIGSKGVYKSIDSGASWVKSSSHLPSTDPFFALTIDPKNQTTLYLGSQSDLYKSNDAGQNWISSSSGLSITHVESIAIDILDSNIIYVGVYDFHGTFYKSIDGGNNWNTTYVGIPQKSVIYDLVIDSNTPSTLYAGVVVESPVPPYAFRDSGVYKSINNGVSWSAANTGLSNIRPTVLVIAKSNPSTLFVGTFDLGSTDPNYISGLYKSTDGGASWNQANSGLPSNLYIRALAINPKNSAIIYAGIGNAFSSHATGGVYKSIDGGASWSPVNNGLSTKSVQALAIDPNNPDTLYAGTYDGGVFRSINGGGSWSPYNAGLSGTESVTLMTIDSDNPATLYAGFSGLGIFKITGTNGIPVVTTNPATSVTPTSAILNGTVNPNGYATTAQFEYGLTTAYGSTASVTLSPNNGSTSQNVSAAVNGLQPGQTYHFRLAATNSQGNGTSSDSIFVTTSPTSTTTLTSTPNPSTYGQSVTFTATVSSNGATPTGTVIFKADGVAINNCGTNGVVSLTNGIATCTTSSLSVPSSPHAITADYSGDGTYNASSGTLTGGQTVNKANQTITFGPAPTVMVGGIGAVSAMGGASGNTPTFNFINPAVCATGLPPCIGITLAGYSCSTVDGRSAGTCAIIANQAGNDNYNSAPPKLLSFPISTGQALTVNNLNKAGGTVTSDVGGINCGAACNANFDNGAPVMLTAVPITGYQFSGWGGTCSGYGNTCKITMDATKAVIANFEVFKKKRHPGWRRGLLQ